jgi:hypothetical protein
MPNSATLNVLSWPLSEVCNVRFSTAPRAATGRYRSVAFFKSSRSVAILLTSPVGVRRCHRILISRRIQRTAAYKSTRVSRPENRQRQVWVEVFSHALGRVRPVANVSVRPKPALGRDPPVWSKAVAANQANLLRRLLSRAALRALCRVGTVQAAVGYWTVFDFRRLRPLPDLKQREATNRFCLRPQ